MSSKAWLAIVCAWRQGEDDLEATLESAGRSAGKWAVAYAVEDQARQGPGRTRHRGIMAAAAAEVCIVIDAHMRFRGPVLRKLAEQVREEGGLLCPRCHHNAGLSFEDRPYAGGRIVYRARDGKHHDALAWKWSREHTPGVRGCVGGACYAFRRQWYLDVGQPLAALPGWGCDEEALSIACWLSGKMPEVTGGEVAHRYREQAPWIVQEGEKLAVDQSRLALIEGVVSELSARRELEEWQRRNVSGPLAILPSPELDRFRTAMLQAPRKWSEWRATVCEADELDGQQAGGAARAVVPAVLRPVRRRIANPIVTRGGVTCSHCKAVLDNPKVTHSYPNGNRRHVCPRCGNPFISRPPMQVYATA